MVTSTRVSNLSPSKATLLAAHFAASADFNALHSLIQTHASTLRGHILLRVLLCLPETTEPSLYIPFLKAVLSGNALPAGEAEDGVGTGGDRDVEGEGTGGTPTSLLQVTNLPEKIARRKVDQLPPLPLLAEDEEEEEEEEEDKQQQSSVVSYLIQRSRSIDSETGALSIVKALLTPFRTELPRIERYLTGAVDVLSRLVYEYSSGPEEPESGSEGVGDIGGLALFETMSADAGVKILLDRCGMDEVVHDLEVLVAPYLKFKDNDAVGWSVVWEWLGRKIEAGDWVGFVEVVTKWGGPAGDAALQEQYARFAVAGCYVCQDTGYRALEGMRAVEKRVLGFVQSGRGARGARDVYKAPTVLGDLLDKENPLTTPHTESLMLLDLLITSASFLSLPLAAVAKVKLEGTHDDQKTLLVRYVRSGANWTKRSDEDWRKIKDGAVWLRTKSGVLGELSAEETEKVLLAGMLAATRFALVKEIYLSSRGGPLAQEDVERSILDAFQEFYDNASNGNKTRGSMKNALNTLQIIFPHTSKSTALTRAHRLVTATHALSHYSLTLTPGVPLLPVQIRIHPDPPSLIARLLDSNPKSYTQSDALTTIAKDLTFGTTGVDGGRKTAARILGMCVEAALSEGDFETAYSLTSYRLVSMTEATENDTEDVRDVIWRTCFQAGRYRSPYAMLIGDTTAHGGGKTLRIVEMRMELLAQALRMCPAHALSEVLATWQRCEEELQMGLREDEEEEERHVALWGAGGSGGEVGVGGGGGGSRGRRKEDEAPMGLFAVARGAAQAFRVSAFPLGGAEREGGIQGGGAPAWVEEERAEEEQRTRKRDMVSGMVTHGLASGLGWVLGAQPNTPGR